MGGSKQSNELYELVDGVTPRAVIRVIGVGGGGCNTVNQMSAANIEGVEFIVANTDRDHLEKCRPTLQLQIGAEVTRGLGAGSNPKVGREAAEEDRDRIREMLEGTDLLFITAGMGGGTGTGAAPVIAEVAREHNLLVAGGGSKKIAQMVISDGDYARQGDTMLRDLNVRFRDIRQGPDGFIYVLTEGRLRGPKDTDGMLLRIEPPAVP